MRGWLMSSAYFFKRFYFFPFRGCDLVHLSLSFSLSFSLFFLNIESTARFPPPRDVQVKFKPESDF